MSKTCSYCDAELVLNASRLNRAIKAGLPLYCNRECAGLARRKGKSDDQKREEKRLYDIEYRAKNIGRITAAKKEYFKRTYNPGIAAIERKKTMDRHVEYCRHPEYKKYKKAYDQEYRAKKVFGDWSGAFLALLTLESEVEQRASKYEIMLQNGTLNKAQKRRRCYERTDGGKS